MSSPNSSPFTPPHTDPSARVVADAIASYQDRRVDALLAEEAAGQARPEAKKFKETGDLKDALIETVAFTPSIAAEQIQTSPAVRGNWFKKGRDAEYRTEYQPRKTPNGEDTVLIAYKYDNEKATEAALVKAGAAPQQETNFERPGNMHAYVVEVPKSVAKRFQEAMKADPTMPRKLADALIQKHAPESYKGRWNAEKQREARVIENSLTMYILPITLTLRAYPSTSTMRWTLMPSR